MGKVFQNFGSSAALLVIAEMNVKVDFRIRPLSLSDTLTSEFSGFGRLSRFLS
jgi:hypothetical protein